MPHTYGFVIGFNPVTREATVTQRTSMAQALSLKRAYESDPDNSGTEYIVVNGTSADSVRQQYPQYFLT